MHSKVGRPRRRLRTHRESQSVRVASSQRGAATDATNSTLSQASFSTQVQGASTTSHTPHPPESCARRRFVGCPTVTGQTVFIW
jgi:hypothetical protein